MFEWIFGKKNDTAIEAKSVWTYAQPIAPRQLEANDIWNKTSSALSNIYNNHAIVRSAIDEIATAVSSLELVLKDKNGNIITNHESIDLIWSTKNMISLMNSRKNLSGASYVIINKFKNKKYGIEKLVLIPSNYVTNLNMTGEDIVSFEVPYLMGQNKNVPANQMIYWYYPDPDQINLCSSPLSSCARDIVIDKERQDLIAEILANRQLLGNSISTDKDLTRPQIEMIEEKLNAKYGKANRGKTVILPSGLQVKNGNDVNDIDFTSLNNNIEARICTALGVPPAVLGLDTSNVTYSNYESARRSFYIEKVIPEARSLADTLTQTLLPHYGMVPFKDAYYEFDLNSVEAIKADTVKQSVAFKNLVQAGMTVDEAKLLVFNS